MRAYRLTLCLMICAIVAIAGCTSAESTQAGDAPTVREQEIARHYYDYLSDNPNVSEEHVRTIVAEHYKITEKELSDIYLKVIEYNLETTGKVWP